MGQSASQILDVIAPQFASDPGKASFLELAALQTTACFYGTKSEYATALRAAHMLTLSSRGTGDAGSVASKKEGDLSLSYFAGQAENNPDLGQTSFGRQLLGLRKGSGLFVGVTGGNDSGCS